jgi:hypothetical protein
MIGLLQLINESTNQIINESVTWWEILEDIQQMFNL